MMKKKTKIQSELDRMKAELDAKRDELNDIKNEIDNKINELGDKPEEVSKEEFSPKEEVIYEEQDIADIRKFIEEMSGIKPKEEEKEVPKVKQEESKGEEISDEELKEKAEHIFKKIKSDYEFKEGYDVEKESWLKSFWIRRKETITLILGFPLLIAFFFTILYLFGSPKDSKRNEQTDESYKSEITTYSITENRIDSIISSHKYIKYEIHAIKRDSLTGLLIADIVKSNEKNNFNSIEYGYTGNINLDGLLDSLVELNILNAKELYDYNSMQSEGEIDELENEIRRLQEQLENLY